MRARRATQLIGTRAIRTRAIRLSARCALSICLIATSLTLAACSSQPSAQPAPDAFAVLQSIPAANPAKYADSREKKNWQNPYLVVRAENVGLLTGVTANQEQMLKPEDVLDTLAHLPPSAWPYGRVAAILVQQIPTGPEQSAEQQRVALRRNRGTVAGELERAHVEIVWMPAATP